jgi:HPt (histidine-containing phosphotransfer) domain-containing protein
MNDDFNELYPPISVDRSILDEYVELLGDDGIKSLHRLITIFLETSPGLLFAMDEALKSGNLQDLRRASHSIKSSSASLGATGLSELCLGLEMKAFAALKTGEPPESLDEYRKGMARIQAEYERVRLALSAIRDEPEP